MDDALRKKFDLTYSENLHKIRHFCYSYIQDPDLCEDIVQDVFITLWGRMEFIDTQKDILPYLITLAKNRCLNLLTKENVRKKYNTRKTSSAKDELNAMALHELSASRLYSAEIESIFSKALESMPPKVKDTYIQIRLNGIRYKKLAEAEQISVKTLERRITIATAILRKSLRDYVDFIVILLATLVN